MSELTLDGPGHDPGLTHPVDRAEPFCRYFGECGGCTLQNFGPVSYAQYKRGVIERSMSKAGVMSEVGALVDAYGAGRRRATLHVRGGHCGYMKRKSHDIIDIEECPILVTSLRRVAPEMARQIGALASDCDIAFTATSTGLDVSVRTVKKLRADRLTLLAQRLAVARMTVNGDLVLQVRPPEIAVGQARVELPPASFLQATEKAEEVLAALVAEGVGKAKSVADLFCGVGVFALRLAERARVYAADSDRPAIAALGKAVRMTQGLKPVTAVARDLFRNPLAPVELAPYDAVVFDPPRAGAEAQARELSRSQVKTVVSVSCDARSFARDAAILVAGGYRIESVVPVDQFAWSTHVEIVAVFRR